MTAQAWFDEQQYEVAPGGMVVATLSVSNLSATSGTFSITPLGLAANYVTVTPAVVTLFPNEQTEVSVEIRPPLSPSTTAGLTSLAVRVVPHENPDDLAFAETGIEITEFLVIGLARNIEEVGRPLCPCMFFEDKQAEVEKKFWICPCEEMQRWKYCH